MSHSMGAAAAFDSACRIGFWGLEKTVAAPIAKVCKLGYNIAHDVGAQTYLKAIHPGYAKVCNGLGVPLKLATGQWFGDAAWKWASKKRFTKGFRDTLSWPIQKCIRKYGITPLVRQHLLGYYVENTLKNSSSYRFTRWGAGWFGKSEHLDRALEAKIDAVSKKIVDCIEDKILQELSRKIANSVCGSIAGVGSSYLWGRALARLMGADQAGLYIDVVRWAGALGPKTIYALLEQTHSLLPDRIANLPGIKPVVEDLRQKEELEAFVTKIEAEVFSRTNGTVAEILERVLPERPCNQEAANKVIAEIALYLLANKMIKKQGS